MSLRHVLLTSAVALAVALPVTAHAATVTLTDLHLRTGAGTMHPSLTTMPAGAGVIVHQCIHNAFSVRWCQVTFNGVTGWANGNFLTAVAPEGYGVQLYAMDAAPPIYDGRIYDGWYGGMNFDGRPDYYYEGRWHDEPYAATQVSGD